MKGLRLHWTLHPDKSAGLYYDAEGKPRSPWYDSEIKSKQMTKAAVARELDISYELSIESVVFSEFRDSHILRAPFEINPYAPIYRFVDYGRVNCCLFSQFMSNGTLCFFKEIVLTGSSTDAQAKAVQSFSLQLDADRFIDYGDPSGEYGDVNYAMPSTTIMNNHGIYPTSKAHKLAGARRLASRNEMMKLKLSERIGQAEAVVVHHKMQTTIDALQSGYRYMENKNGEILDTIYEVHPYEDVIDCMAGTIFEVFNASKLAHIDVTPTARRRNKHTGY